MKLLLILTLLMAGAAQASELKNCKETSILVCDGQRAVVIKKSKKAKAQTVKYPPAKALNKRVVFTGYTYTTDNTKRNIVYLFVHRPITGTKTQVNGTTATFKQEEATVPGIGYMRTTDSSIAMGIAVDYLQTVQLAVGYGF